MQNYEKMNSLKLIIFNVLSVDFRKNPGNRKSEKKRGG